MSDRSDSVNKINHDIINNTKTKPSLIKYQSPHHFRDMKSLKNYEIIQKLGQGTFGVVQKAKDYETGELVALKQLINHSAKEGFPITAMREITILKSLNHENVLKIIDMIYDPPKVNNAQDVVHLRGCFYTVSPYMSSDLVGLLENPKIKLNLPEIKCLMIQLLKGIQYIHENHYLHRDIKAANILIDSNGVLKIADFGLARNYHGSVPKLNQGPGGGEKNYTALVVTRWYRPPELLLGERKYTTAVDIWGVGCVFGELFIHRPILAGQSDSQQAQIIFDLVGPPNQINWSDAAKLPNKNDFSIGLRCKRTLESRFLNYLNNDGVDLLSGLLSLDPYKRLNAIEALHHPYFKNDPQPLNPFDLPKYEESHEIDKERFKKLKASNTIIEESKKSNSIPPISRPTSGLNLNNNNHNNKAINVNSNTTKVNNVNRPSERYGRNTDTYIPGGKQSSYRTQTSHSPTINSLQPKARPHTETYIPDRAKSMRDNHDTKKTTPLNYGESNGNGNNYNNNSRQEVHKKVTDVQELNTNNTGKEPNKVVNPTIPTDSDSRNLLKVPSLAPTNKNESQASTPSQPSPVSKSLIRSSGIFMTQSRKPKPKVRPTALSRSTSNVSDRLSKKRKLVDADNNDSDLTDFGEDVKSDEDSNKLDSFLDWERYAGTSDYKNLETAKKQHKTSDKLQNIDN